MLRTLVVFAILIPGIGAAVVNRYAALLLYLWFAIFRPQEWLWFDITPLHPSLVLGLLVVVPSFLTGKLPNLTHPLMFGSLLFVATAIGAQTNAVRPDIGWQWVDFIARLVLICALTVTLANTRERFLGVLATIAGSFAFFTAKAGLLFLLGGGVQFQFGLSGSFIDNNGYALGTVMIIPLLLATAQNVTNRWVRWAFLAGVPLSMLTVVGTFSRGGFVGLIAAALAHALLQRRRLVSLGALGGLALAALLVVPIPDRYFDRMQTIRTYEEVEDQSAMSRLHFWRVAWQMALDHPTGIGLHNYEKLYDRYDSTNGQYGRGRAVHNSTMEVLAETGFVGATVWLSLFAMAFWRCWRIRRWANGPAAKESDRRFFRTMATALIVSMVGFAVSGSFIALALNDVTWLTFALVATLDYLWRDASQTAALSSDSAACVISAREFPKLRGDAHVAS